MDNATVTRTGMGKKKSRINCYSILSELSFKLMPWSSSQYIIQNLFPDIQVQSNLSKEV